MRLRPWGWGWAVWGTHPCHVSASDDRVVTDVGHQGGALQDVGDDGQGHGCLLVSFPGDPKCLIRCSDGDWRERPPDQESPSECLKLCCSVTASMVEVTNIHQDPCGVCRDCTGEVTGL